MTGQSAKVIFSRSTSVAAAGDGEVSVPGPVPVSRTVVDPKSRLHLDGLGSRLSRPFGAPRGNANGSVGGRPGATWGRLDRCAARARGLVLVQVAGVNRVGLPDPQRGGLAEAADPAYRAYSLGPPLAGAGRGHVVGAGVWHLR
jgi:hypothetical protein